jgi:hypothetical protein
MDDAKPEWSGASQAREGINYHHDRPGVGQWEASGSVPAAHHIIDYGNDGQTLSSGKQNRGARLGERGRHSAR